MFHFYTIKSGCWCVFITFCCCKLFYCIVIFSQIEMCICLYVILKPIDSITQEKSVINFDQLLKIILQKKKCRRKILIIVLFTLYLLEFCSYPIWFFICLFEIDFFSLNFFSIFEFYHKKRNPIHALIYFNRYDLCVCLNKLVYAFYN